MTTTTTQPTRTSAEKIIGAWTDGPRAEGANAQLTTAEIMSATGLSRTTVNDNLRKLAEGGSVIRFDQGKVTTWSLTPTRKAAIKRAAKKAAQSAHNRAEKAKVIKPTPKPAPFAKRLGKAERGLAESAGLVKARQAVKATKGNTVTDAAETVETTPAARTETGRRTKGAIDFEIRDWFEANDNTPAGAYLVAKGVGCRSGAAYVALKRMDREGKATLVSTEPDRYSINFESEAWNA